MRIFLALILSMLSAMVAPEMAHAAGNIQQLRLTLSIDGPPSVKGETALLVVLSNPTKEPISLPHYPGWDELGGLELHVVPANDRRTSLGHLRSAARRLAARAGSTAWTLGPGMSIGITRNVRTEEVVDASGRGRLIATYQAKGASQIISDPIELVVK